MPPSKDLFERLRDRDEIAKLINTTENLYLDCKIWPKNEDDGWNILSKAMCGFANADGGVILVGMEAKPAAKLDPDTISGEKPVADALFLQGRIEAMVGELVEPGLQGVETHCVLSGTCDKSGFVVIHVPASEGYPSRSRRTKLFHQRIASGTYPMEYFQIADMFGRRTRPQLRMSLKRFPAQIVKPDGGRLGATRSVLVSVSNAGRGLAKFPFIRIRAIGLTVNGGNVHTFKALHRLSADENEFAFGGGVDNVIHPGTTIKLIELVQSGRVSPYQIVEGARVFVFDSVEISCHMFAEGVDVHVDKENLPEAQIMSEKEPHPWR